LAWRDILRISDFLELLENEFFPRWLRVLEFWLKNSGKSAENYSEIIRWYFGWKNVFEKCDLLYPSIVVEFDRALHLMNIYYCKNSEDN